MNGHKAHHPNYDAEYVKWAILRDLKSGETAVKSKGIKYLPPTSGMIADGMGLNERGYHAYQAYKMRAVFHNYVSEAVNTMLGMLHCRPAVIELPEQMEFIRDKATLNGESLEMLLRKINEQQLLVGRACLLVDINSGLDNIATPYIALYNTEDVINWNDTSENRETMDLSFVVIEENINVLSGDGYSWKAETRYRILNMESGYYGQEIYSGNNENQFDAIDISLNGKKLDEIPFVFINTKDLAHIPDEPPLMSLAYLSLAIYRGEADYRQNLFMQSQDTLVLIGNWPNSENQDIRIGAGSMIKLPEGSDAKYVGVTSSGLSEQRQAIDNDKQEARSLANQMMDVPSSDESGVALNLRLSAQTASLNQIATTGAAGLERALKYCAKWMGLNEDEVKVTANTDFLKKRIPASDIVSIMTAKKMGAPISTRTVHGILIDQGLTLKDYEEELENIGNEQEEEFNQASGFGGLVRELSDDEEG